MALEDIVSVSITASTASPSRPGFGTMLAAVQNVPAGWGAAVVKTYNQPADLLSDGFLSTQLAYRMAQRYFAANPRPKQMKVGKRVNKSTQSLKLKCLSAVQNDVYSVVLVSSTNVLTTITRTVPGSSTTTAEATAIAALIAAVTGFAGTTSSTDTITIPGTLGVIVGLKNWTKNFKFTDATPDPGVAADLAAIYVADPDFYGLQLDSQSELELEAAAPWVESTQNKLMMGTTSDGDVTDNAVTTDVASDFKLASYKASGLIYNGNETLGFSGAAWMGNRFVDPPGSDTWALKNLPLITPDALSATQFANTIAKNCNVYVTTASLNHTWNGKMPNGDWADTRRGIDWLVSEIKVRVFSKLINAKKVPYTNAGVDGIVSIIKGALKDAEAVGLLAAGWIVTAPKVEDIDPSVRATRILPSITFTATLAGAIHSTTISGTVSA